MKFDDNLKRILALASGEAQKEFHSADARRRQVSKALDKLSHDILEHRNDISARGETEAIKKAYDDFISRFNLLMQSSEEGLALRFRERKKTLNRVTVMLFGRTLVGKSTLMEALRKGTGRAIGLGLQNFTLEIRRYDWKNLSIVDTPGIEGLDGEELARKAREFVDQADYILFMVSDDKVLPEDFEALGRIRDQNKPVVIVLNVKEKDLDLLLEDADKVFDEKELRGHMQRIEKYALKHFLLRRHVVIPLHAHAAWASICEKDRKKSRALREASRIAEFEDKFLKIVRETAVAARVKAPHESLAYYFERLSTGLETEARELKKTENFMARARKKYKNSCQDIWDEGVVLLRRLKETTYDINQECGEIAEDAVDGTLDLDSEWKQRMELLFGAAEDLEEKVRKLIDERMKLFLKEIQSELEALEAAQSNAGGVEGPNAGAVRIARDAKRATRIGGAVLGGGLGLVGAILLASNPVGLAFLGASTLVGIISWLLGDHFADTEKRQRRREIGKLRKDLKDQLWGNYRQLNDQCYRWMKKAIDTMRDEGNRLIETQTSILSHSCALMWKLVEQLRILGRESNVHILTRLLGMIVPAFKRGDVEIVAAARYPGRKCRISVRRIRGKGSCVGAVIGKGGTHIKEVSYNLSDERIEVFEHSDSAPLLIARALGLPDDAAERIEISDGVATITSYKPDECRQIVGRKRSNITLAEVLTEFKIQVERGIK